MWFMSANVCSFLLKKKKRKSVTTVKIKAKDKIFLQRYNDSKSSLVLKKVFIYFTRKARVKFWGFSPRNLALNIQSDQKQQALSRVSPSSRRASDSAVVLNVQPDMRILMFDGLELATTCASRRPLGSFPLFSTSCAPSWKDGTVGLFRDLLLMFQCLNRDFYWKGRIGMPSPAPERHGFVGALQGLPGDAASNL